jgi:hypothetical protein
MVAVRQSRAGPRPAGIVDVSGSTGRRATPVGRGEQHACFDPRVGQVLFGPAHRIEDAQAQQIARRLPAEGVSGRGDAAPVEATAEAGNVSIEYTGRRPV